MFISTRSTPGTRATVEIWTCNRCTCGGVSSCIVVVTSHAVCVWLARHDIALGIQAPHVGFHRCTDWCSWLDLCTVGGSASCCTTVVVIHHIRLTWLLIWWRWLHAAFITVQWVHKFMWTTTALFKDNDHDNFYLQQQTRTWMQNSNNNYIAP